MKIRNMPVLGLVIVGAVMALSAACGSHTVGGINLDRLEEGPPGEGPRIDAYFQPLGERRFALKDMYFNDPVDPFFKSPRGKKYFDLQSENEYFTSPQEPMPRSHIFFALQKIVAGLDGSDISLSKSVHVRADSETIEFTFSKNNNETITVKVPPELDAAVWLGGYGREQTAYWHKGRLLILHSSASRHPGVYTWYSSAIVFQKENDALTVHTREHERHQATVPVFHYPFLDFTKIQKEGYVYKMISDSSPAEQKY